MKIIAGINEREGEKRQRHKIFDDNILSSYSTVTIMWHLTKAYVDEKADGMAEKENGMPAHRSVKR